MGEKAQNNKVNAGCQSCFEFFSLREMNDKMNDKMKTVRMDFE